MRTVTYLSDGLYASYDGYQIRLYTERRPGNVHEVYLNDGTLAAFEGFVARIRAGERAERSGEE